MSSTRGPLRTVKPADPAILARWQLSRRRGDKADSRCELLRRVALRPRDRISSSDRTALYEQLGPSVLHHWAETGQVRPGRGEDHAVQVSRAARERREELFAEIDRARPPAGRTAAATSIRTRGARGRCRVDLDRPGSGRALRVGEHHAAARELQRRASPTRSPCRSQRGGLTWPSF